MPKAICRKCEIEFVFESVRGGRKLCDGCSRRRSQQDYRARNPERVRESQRRWRAANPERRKELARESRARNPEAEQQRGKARWADPEKRAKSQAGYRKWAAKNRPKLAAKTSQWQRDNPDKVHARQLRRKARQMGAARNDFTADEWQELLAEHAYSCFYCGRTNVPLEREHMVPLSRGGNHSKDNIVPSCGPCNRAKATMTAEEFYDRLGDRSGSR